MHITWLGHSSIKIETHNHIIYIDPYAGNDEWYQIASIVLISRFHFDHCSVEKTRRLIGDRTHVFGTAEVAREIYPCRVLQKGETAHIDDIEIVAMPVMNPHADFQGHDERENAIGFVILAEKKVIYFMADSDYLPQTKDMKPDVLFIAVGGTYTAAAREAAENTNEIHPKLAIPIHWGSLVGTKDDALLFSELAKCHVKILDVGRRIEI